MLIAFTMWMMERTKFISGVKREIHKIKRYLIDSLMSNVALYNYCATAEPIGR